MNERAVAFRVGVVVLAALVIAALLVFIFGEGRTLFQRTYTITIRFPQAPNVTADTPVRKSGVLIGRVTQVELVDDGGVDVSMRINRSYGLKNKEFCRIGTSSFVTGDAVLEFVPAREEQLLPIYDRNNNGLLDANERAELEAQIEPNEYSVNGFVQPSPADSFTQIADRFPTALENIERTSNELYAFVRSLNQTVGQNEGRLERIGAKTEEALDKFNANMGFIQDLLGDADDAKENIQLIFAEIPSILENLNTTLETANSTFDETRSLVASVREGLETNLENLENFTGPLGQRGGDLITKLDSTLTNFDRLTGEIASLTESVNQGEGTIGRLLRDESLYEDLRGAIGNFNETSQNVNRVVRRLEPVVKDIRVFSDKIARDPRQLGIKGALDRRPSGSGLKTPLRLQ